MLKGIIVLFREGFEAFLILFLVIGFLKKSGATFLNKFVYAGALVATLASIILGFVFRALDVEFEGATEEIFEGVAMTLTSLMLAFMILWLVKFKTNTSAIKDQVNTHALKNNGWGIFFLVFLSVFREGVETVLFFMIPEEGETGSRLLMGGVIGLIISFGLCYAIFKGTVRLNFSSFFKITSIVLLVIAAGLFARGVHELQEAHWIPELGEAFNLNPAALPDGSFPALHEKGNVGKTLTSIFGYNGNPDWMEIIAYWSYAIVVVLLWRSFEKKGAAKA